MEGQQSGKFIITDDRVRAIRHAAAHGTSVTTLAHQYALDPSTILRILRRQTHTDVPPAPPPASFVRLERAGSEQQERYRLSFARWLWELLGEPPHLRFERTDDQTVCIRLGDRGDVTVQGGVVPACFMPSALRAALRWEVGEYSAAVQLHQPCIRVAATAAPMPLAATAPTAPTSVDWRDHLADTELDIQTIAQLVDRDYSTILALIRQQRIVARKVGAHWAVSLPSVLEFFGREDHHP